MLNATTCGTPRPGGWLLGLVCACAVRAGAEAAPRLVAGDDRHPRAAEVAGPDSTELDGDLDGVPDRRDGCPYTRGVEPDGCPPRDRDQDGHPDRHDRCPELAGAAEDGCPIPDVDDDGVPDPRDRCLDAAEIANGYEDEDGCPDVVPRDLEAITGVVRGVDFEINKSDLMARSQPVLDRIAAVMRKYPATRFEIGGHLAGPPGPSYGKDLSHRRAQSVKAYLVEQGVAEGRLETRGALADEPIDTNRTAAGRARNRRIEITLLLSYDLVVHAFERRIRGHSGDRTATPQRP
ncbi:MAG: OmpA family protein [Nannocystaceae bacterium]